MSRVQGRKKKETEEEKEEGRKEGEGGRVGIYEFQVKMRLPAIKYDSHINSFMVSLTCESEIYCPRFCPINPIRSKREIGEAFRLTLHRPNPSIPRLLDPDPTMSSPSSSSPKQASIQGLGAPTRQVRRRPGLAATSSPFSDEAYIEEDKGASNRKPSFSSSSSGQPSRAPSHPSSVYCKICMESVSVSESFTTGMCSHAFCSECIRHHITAKVEENCGTVTCPEQGCPTVLDPQLCQFIIPFEVFVQWGKILCEGSIGEPLKFYCPYKDCSALLVDDGKVVIREAECPHCHRLFCAQCRTPWHSDIDCAEFQKLGKHEREKEDIMLRSLAKDRKWGRCSRCGYYVEKVSGCSYIVCRCKHPFCYFCGAQRDVHKYRCDACKR